jgi:hypothetical protein
VIARRAISDAVARVGRPRHGDPWERRIELKEPDSLLIAAILGDRS